VVEAEGVAVKSVGDFVAVGGQLRQVGAHGTQCSRAMGRS
jgi:hypothetical protein